MGYIPTTPVQTDPAHPLAGRLWYAVAYGTPSGGTYAPFWYNAQNNLRVALPTEPRVYVLNDVVYQRHPGLTYRDAWRLATSDITGDFTLLLGASRQNAYLQMVRINGNVVINCADFTSTSTEASALVVGTGLGPETSSDSYPAAGCIAITRSGSTTSFVYVDPSTLDYVGRTISADFPFPIEADKTAASGDIAWAYCATRALSTEEVLSLVASPYQLLTGQPRLVAGGSVASASATGQGVGQVFGGSPATVAVTATGNGQVLVGAISVSVVTPTGSGSPYFEGGGAATAILSASGTGGASMDGGSTAESFVEATGTGEVPVTPSIATITVTSTGTGEVYVPPPYVPPPTYGARVTDASLVVYPARLKGLLVFGKRSKDMSILPKRVRNFFGL